MTGENRFQNALHFDQQFVNFSEPCYTSILLKQVKHRWNHTLFLSNEFEMKICTIFQLCINIGSGPA